jgi:hypothetical protein
MLFILNYTETHPWIQVLEPWGKYNLHSNWVIVAPPLVNREAPSALAAAKILAEEYPL